MIVAPNLARLRSLPGVDAPGSCVLVPTMGALHEGHAALIRMGATFAKAAKLPGGCVVSVFVNPTQFNDPADFARYPRTIDADAAVCRASGASAMWTPEITEMYPLVGPVPVPALPKVATAPGLEDAHRPGHFAGVCQAVARLFTLVRPAAAIFGEKDWQQLQVVRAMTTADRLPVQIVPGPTVREPDGLAMSSRNRFLSPDDRARAVALSRALREAQQGKTPDEAEGIMRRVLRAAGLDIDYAVVRDAATLERPSPLVADAAATKWRALIAARAGSVRLLDNAEWTPPGAGSS